LAGRLEPGRAAQAVEDLAGLAVERADHTCLLPWCWQLRDNLTVYDAAYVALAEALGVPLVTVDHRLAAATGPRCTIETIALSG